MNPDRISELYHTAKDSGMFTNLIPSTISHRRTYSSGLDWIKIYGKHRHNLPHNFYLGVNHTNLVLVGHFKEDNPIWIKYNFDRLGNVPEYQQLRELERARQDSDEWPYLVGVNKSIVDTSQILTTEEIMISGPESIKDFIMFNMDLFV